MILYIRANVCVILRDFIKSIKKKEKYKLMYKIETHLHTKLISKCGWLYPEEIVKSYYDCGYSGICVTEHYNRTCFEYAGIDLSSNGDKLNAFLEGFRQVKKAAEKYGIVVYEGAELRFDQCDNDYLIYGFSHELLADPDRIIKMGIHNFISLSRADGAILFQAHPFRPSCIPAPAEYLDGIEVRNMNCRHNNHNDLALEYAERHNLLQSGGSDCHRPGDECTSGIISDYLPKDSAEFASLLRSGNYSII